MPLHGHTRLSLRGQPVHTMFYMSAFAEYAVVTADCAVAIPPAMRWIAPVCWAAGFSPARGLRRASPRLDMARQR